MHTVTYTQNTCTQAHACLVFAIGVDVSLVAITPIVGSHCKHFFPATKWHVQLHNNAKLNVEEREEEAYTLH